MPFYTKVDYSRQLRQPSETTARFSGSTLMEQNLNVYSGITGDGSFAVYKPASWKAPHLKGDYVRGNIFDSTTFENTDPHGGWLYHNSSFNQGSK